MQNSVLQIRNFLNRKAPFMIRDFDSQKKEDYMMVKIKVRNECEELLCSNNPKISQSPIEIGEYFVEDLLIYIYQALKGPPHEKFNGLLGNSWSEFDLDITSLPGLKIPDPNHIEDERYMLAEEKDLLDHLKKFNELWADPELYET